MFAHLSDDEFLLMGDIPDILSELKNGFNGRASKRAIRRAIDTGTRASQFYAELLELVSRDYAMLDEATQEICLTRQGWDAPLY